MDRLNGGLDILHLVWLSTQSIPQALGSINKMRLKERLKMPHDGTRLPPKTWSSNMLRTSGLQPKKHSSISLWGKWEADVGRTLGSRSPAPGGVRQHHEAPAGPGPGQAAFLTIPRRAGEGVDIPQRGACPHAHSTPNSRLAPANAAPSITIARTARLCSRTLRRHCSDCP